MKKIVVLFLLVFGVLYLVSAEEICQREKIDSIRSHTSIPVIYVEHRDNLLPRTIYGSEYLIPMHKASREQVLKLVKASLHLNPGLNPKKVPAGYVVLLNTKEVLLYTENIYIYSRNEHTLEYLVDKILETPFLPE